MEPSAPSFTSEDRVEKIEDQTAPRVRALQLVTIVWMTGEFSIALFSGLRAHSVSLIAFGADSAIELLSAALVWRRFSIGVAEENRTAQFTAVLLYALGAYIILAVFLTFFGGQSKALPTLTGIVLLLCAAIVMPLLAMAKRALASQSCSRSLRADAAQSSLCAYMSWIGLGGLLLNSFFGLAWADSVAALLLLPIVFKEAEDARKGEACRCS